MPRRKTRRLWSVVRIQHSKYPDLTLRITELRKGGVLYAVRMESGKQRMTSLKRTRADLGPTDKAQRKAATALALELIEEFSTRPPAYPTASDGGLTLEALATLYQARGLIDRPAKYRHEQTRKIRHVLAVLGAQRPVTSLRPSDVAHYTAQRKADGVRQGTIHGELAAVRIMCNWGKRDRVLDENPLAPDRVTLEHERNPLRVVASPGRVQKLRDVADQLPPAFGALLNVAVETGKRISAILRLKWEDIEFEAAEHAPHGAITWYAGCATTKKRRERTVPMNRLASTALARWLDESPGIRAAPVFPALTDPTRPLSYRQAYRWLTKAEQLAGLPALAFGKWHTFRRAWGTARKDLPLVDVAVAGDWHPDTLLKHYQQSDPETVLRVVEGFEIKCRKTLCLYISVEHGYP